MGRGSSRDRLWRRMGVRTCEMTQLATYLEYRRTVSVGGSSSHSLEPYLSTCDGPGSEHGMLS